MSSLRNFLTTALCAVCLSTNAWSAPKSEAWEVWDRSDEANVSTIDHSAWQGFLDRYLVASERDVNRVRYGKVSPGDRKLLRAYLNSLQRVDPRRFRKSEQKAYWINFYNAATVDLIVADYPVESIRKIRSGWFSFGPWDRVVGKVAGHEVTLNDIEHRILRPLFRDPLIHFGVNCASVGCPDLIGSAYTGANVDALLAGNSKAYVASSRGHAFRGGELVLSSIFDWFAEDFGGEAGVLKFLARNLPEDSARRVAEFRGNPDYRYDWTLNDAP